MSGTSVVIYDERLQAYNPSDDLERPVRRTLATSLLFDVGLAGRAGAPVISPPEASVEEIERTHHPAYVRAVRRFSAQPALVAGDLTAPQWGFIPGHDTVARQGMHEHAAVVCGAALHGARLIRDGSATRAFCTAPSGLHHAHANRASGFCLYNDCAVAIQGALDAGAGRVAYLDLDAHHGDGVEAIFAEDPRVLVCSVHERAQGFFPGTGDVEDRGRGAGLGFTINVPLPPFAGDAPFRRALTEVFAPAVRRFRPQILVTHLGVDVHHADPMAHLTVSTAALAQTYAELSRLADEATGGRWLVLTGGGYNVHTLGPLWTLQLAALAGREPPAELPVTWRAAVVAATGVEPPLSPLADTPPAYEPERRAAADRRGNETIDLLLAGAATTHPGLFAP